MKTLMSCSSNPEGRYHQADRNLQEIKDLVWTVKDELSSIIQADLAVWNDLFEQCPLQKLGRSSAETQHWEGWISHSHNLKYFHRVIRKGWSLSNSKTRWESQQNNASLIKFLVSSTHETASISWVNWDFLPS